jgi:hypothetical protein
MGLSDFTIFDRIINHPVELIETTCNRNLYLKLGILYIWKYDAGVIKYDEVKTLSIAV